MLVCPNCGNGVQEAPPVVKMATCESCGSTLFVNDAAVRLAGQAGIISDAPLLFGLNDQVHLGDTVVTLHGHAQYSYGRGFWDEFWGLTDLGKPVWVSVDEGDIILQRALGNEKAPALDRPPALGQVVEWDHDDYRVSELSQATCVALQGQFDEPLTVRDVHQFANLTGPGARLLSGEFWEGGSKWFVGTWCDPFEIEVRNLV